MKGGEKRILVLDTADNVGVALADVENNETLPLKGKEGCITLSQTVPFGHKVALTPIVEGSPIIKYGESIGTAAQSIAPGEWVHLHNMKSIVDPDFRARIES